MCVPWKFLQRGRGSLLAPLCRMLPKAVGFSKVSNFYCFVNWLGDRPRGTPDVTYEYLCSEQKLLLSNCRLEPVTERFRVWRVIFEQRRAAYWFPFVTPYLCLPRSSFHSAFPLVCECNSQILLYAYIKTALNECQKSIMGNALLELVIRHAEVLPTYYIQKRILQSLQSINTLNWFVLNWSMALFAARAPRNKRWLLIARAQTNTICFARARQHENWRRAPEAPALNVVQSTMYKN